MKIDQLVKLVPRSRRQIDRLLHMLKIKPVGLGKPREYPEHTAILLKAHLGLYKSKDGRIVSLRELRAERRKARLERRVAA